MSTSAVLTDMEMTKISIERPDLKTGLQLRGGGLLDLYSDLVNDNRQFQMIKTAVD